MVAKLKYGAILILDSDGNLVVRRIVCLDCGGSMVTKRIIGVSSIFTKHVDFLD